MENKKLFLICIILFIINTILVIPMGFVNGCLFGCKIEFNLLQFMSIYAVVLVPNFMSLFILYYYKNLWSNIIYILSVVITIVSQISTWINFYLNRINIFWWITFLLPMIIFFVLLIICGLQRKAK